MSSREPLVIAAVVHDAERPALVAASEQLAECLASASGSPWDIRLRFCDAISAIDLSERPTVVVASLLTEVVRYDEPPASTEARWREHLSLLARAAIPAIFLCTVFHHVARRSSDRDLASRTATVERIRRLNLMAVELSHDTGIGVIDIDRLFAHFGAQKLNTDYRLAGPVAAEVAAYAIVSALLGFGLDDLMPPEIQERAKEFQGSLWDIGKLVSRRLGRPK